VRDYVGVGTRRYYYDVISARTSGSLLCGCGQQLLQVRGCVGVLAVLDIKRTLLWNCGHQTLLLHSYIGVDEVTNK
jgi:hypothetical protein